MIPDRSPDFSRYLDTQSSEARRTAAEAEDLDASKRRHRRDVSVTKRRTRNNRIKLPLAGAAAAVAVGVTAEGVDRHLEHDSLRAEGQAPVAQSVEEQRRAHEQRRAFEHMREEGTIDAGVLRGDSPATTETTGPTDRDATVDEDGVTGSVELDRGADFGATEGVVPEAESGGARYQAPTEGPSSEGGGATAG